MRWVYYVTDCGSLTLSLPFFFLTIIICWLSLQQRLLLVLPLWSDFPISCVDRENVGAYANALFVKVSFNYECQFWRDTALLSSPLSVQKGLLPFVEHGENQCLIKSQKCDCVCPSLERSRPVRLSDVRVYVWLPSCAHVLVDPHFSHTHRARTPLRMQWMQTW